MQLEQGHTEEDRKRILEKADSASPTELLHMLDRYDVHTLSNDKMRRERLKYHLNPKHHTNHKSVAEVTLLYSPSCYLVVITVLF